MITALLVEDEATILLSLSRDFAWAECGIDNVICASDGFDALNKAEQIKPDILVTDLRMPGISGLELAAKMRKMYPDIHIIFISAYNDVAYLKEALKLKAVDYLVKPVDFDELKNAVNNALGLLISLRLATQSAELLESYAVKYKKSSIRSILLRLEDNALLMAQAEAAGLCDKDKQLFWGVHFYEKNHAADISARIMEDKAGVPSQWYNISLDDSSYALVMAFESPAKEVFYSILEAAGLKATHSSVLSPDESGLDRLYGLGTEWILQKSHERSTDFSGKILNTSRVCDEITKYIQKNLREHELSASMVAAALHYTTSYICSIFKREMDTTIHGYINQARMDEARRLLIESTLNIDEISELTGYETESYFCRVFKKHYGVNPAKYRKQNSSK